MRDLARHLLLFAFFGLAVNPFGNSATAGVTDSSGSVVPGSVDNEVHINISNMTRAPMIGVRATAVEVPPSITNLRIRPNVIDEIEDDRSAEFTVLFDVAPGAPVGELGPIRFEVVVRGKLLPFKARLDLNVTPPPELLAYAIRDDAPDDFPVENAIDYCDPAREPTEYDRVAVFFTPPFDVSEPLEERPPFMWRIRGPNDDRLRDGRFAPKLAKPVFAEDGSPERFVAVVDLWNRGDKTDPAKARSGPGTYTVQTVAGDYDATSTFGQGEQTVVLATVGKDENGNAIYAKWEDLKTFEVKSVRLHFQGFVMESVKGFSVPNRGRIWEGELDVADPKVSGSTVVLSANARIRHAQQDGYGRRPKDEMHRASTSVTIAFPQELLPGHEEMGQIHTRIVPGEKGEYLLTAGMHLMIPTNQLPPDRHLVERGAVPTPWAHEGAMPKNFYGRFSWGQERFRTTDHRGDGSWVWGRTPPPGGSVRKEAAELDVRTTLLAGDKDLLAGDPERSLLGHLRDPDTKWVIPVFIDLTDEARVGDYSRSLAMKTYGYAIYAAKPGTYDGPAPTGKPSSGDSPDDQVTDPIADRDGGGRESDGERDPDGGRDGTSDNNVPERGPDTDGTIARVDPNRDTPRPPGTGTPPRPVPDPSTLDPHNPKIAELIREWLRVAEPPENATLGANLRYNDWGVKVGTVPGGTIEARAKPDGAGDSSEAYCWSIRTTLDSVDHCSLETYVLLKLAGQSLAKCCDRYKRRRAVVVGDYRDRPAEAARRDALLDGLKVEMTMGGLASSLARSFTVESQVPAPGDEMDVGGRIHLRVRRKPAIVPDVRGLAARDAVDKVQDAGLKPEPSIEGAATSAELAYQVRRQDPKPDGAVAPGTAVKLYILGPVRTARTVPDCGGLRLDEAIARVRDAGLKAVPALEGAAATERQVHQVKRQEPEAGGQVAPNSVVRLFAYGRVRTAITVPKCLTLPLAKAIKELRDAGLEPDPTIDGAAPSDGQVHTVWKQDPLAGAEVAPGTKVSLFAYRTVSVARTVPRCTRMTFADAAELVRAAGLTPNQEDETRTAPLEAEAGLVWKQEPAADAEVLPRTVVRLWVYRAAVRKVSVPKCVGLTSDDAAGQLRQAGLGADLRTSHAAPSVADTKRVWRQYPEPGAEVDPGSIVVVFRYGAPAPPATAPPASRPTIPRPPQGRPPQGVPDALVWRLQKVERLYATGGREPVKEEDWIGKPSTDPRNRGSHGLCRANPKELAYWAKTVAHGNVLAEWRFHCHIPSLPKELRAGERFVIVLKGAADGHGPTTYWIDANVGGTGLTVEPSPDTPVCVCSREEPGKQVNFSVKVSDRPRDTITLYIGAQGFPAFVRWTYTKVAGAEATRARPGRAAEQGAAQSSDNTTNRGARAVPQCVGKLEKDALASVRAAGLTPEVVERKVRYIHTGRVRGTHVVKQEPAAGTKVMPGATVRLWESFDLLLD